MQDSIDFRNNNLFFDAPPVEVNINLLSLLALVTIRFTFVEDTMSGFGTQNDAFILRFCSRRQSESIALRSPTSGSRVRYFTITKKGANIRYL